MTRHPFRILRRAEPQPQGFTLVELMIVVAIVAVLATVAGIAYVRHIKSARLVAAQQFMSEIAARQQAYFQQHSAYSNASGIATGDGAVFHPGLFSGEPQSHDWNVASFTPADAASGWRDLGARPADMRTYGSFFVRASIGTSDCATNHALNAVAPLTGVPAQPDCSASGPNGEEPTPHPWFYAVGHLDMDGSLSSYSSGGCAASGAAVLQTADCTVLSLSSGRPSVIVLNEGK